MLSSFERVLKILNSLLACTISSYFSDVYIQHPEFIHKATSPPLKIKAKSRSNVINMLAFVLQKWRAQAHGCAPAVQWYTGAAGVRPNTCNRFY